MADTPQSTQTVSCGLRQRLKGDRGPELCFFSPAGEESERSGIILPDARGWSTKSGGWKWGHAVPGTASVRQKAEQNSVTSQSPLSQKHSVRHTRERTCVPDAQHEGRRTGCARACAPARHTHVLSLNHSRERDSSVHRTSARDTDSCVYVGAALWFSGL